MFAFISNVLRGLRDITADMSISRPVYNPVDKIEDHLYLGEYTWAINEDKLKRLNIRTVLSVISGDLSESDKFDFIDYHRIDTEDAPNRDLLSYFPETNQLIDNCQKTGQNILVHCMAGVSRSATIVIAFIMNKYNMSFFWAKDFVEFKRSIICPNIGFQNQLELYEQMKFTLDANNRQFRDYLFLKYVLNKSQSNDINKYFERLSIAEKMTEGFDLGQPYNCAKCGHKLFNQLHVIRNEDQSNLGADVGQLLNTCSVYIELQDWLLEAFINSETTDMSSIGKCINCSENVALIQTRRAVCDCAAHTGSHCLKIRINNNSVTIGPNVHNPNN